MPLWTAAFEPKRAAVLAELCWQHGIVVPGQVDVLHSLLCADRRQHALRRKGRLAQTNTDRVINRVRDRRDRRSQRSFTRFLCAEWAFGVNTLDDVADDFR